MLLCLKSEARNNMYNNHGTFVPFIDIFILTLVFRYATITQHGQQSVFLPLTTLIISLLNIARGLMLNFEHCQRRRQQQETQDEHAPLKAPTTATGNA